MERKDIDLVHGEPILLEVICEVGFEAGYDCLAIKVDAEIVDVHVGGQVEVLESREVT
jgi:hypothetical protein